MSDMLRVGTRKGLFTFARRAKGWSVDRVDFLGEPVSMLLDDTRHGLTYAALDLGHFGAKLRRSADGGANWEEVAVPIYPAGATVPIRPTAPNEPPPEKPASLSEIWALETGGPDRPNVLWAGTIPGGLFRSTDNGSSWNLVTSLWERPERKGWFGGGKNEPGIHSVLVDPRDNGPVTIGISCGGVWRTGDDAASWSLEGKGLRAEFMPPDRAYDQNIQDAHRVAQCRSAPEATWVQHHNGIFHSTDGGRNFREIDRAGPSTFGFAVAAHPTQAGTAWFVPAIKDERRIPVDGRLVVTRTRDGGQTFESLGNGLPQEHCYDIVYRHGLDVDETGDRLVIGSTTGGLWLSENGGDSWATISTNLPPIYCVRFR